MLPDFYLNSHDIYIYIYIECLTNILPMSIRYEVLSLIYEMNYICQYVPFFANPMSICSYYAHVCVTAY